MDLIAWSDGRAHSRPLTLLSVVITGSNSMSNEVSAQGPCIPVRTLLMAVAKPLVPIFGPLLGCTSVSFRKWYAVAKAVGGSPSGTGRIVEGVVR